MQPRVTTVVSSQRTAPGAAIFDRVRVTGLAGETVTVNAAVYGPFAAPDVIKCDTKAVWTGSIAAPADGEYQTEPVTLQTPGFYSDREWIDAGGFVRATTTKCAEVAETTVVVATPEVRTQISDQTTRPGARITDKVIVTGLGALAVTVKVSLFGPFASRGAISCTGKPYWRGTFSARGDGTYTTQPVAIDRVGYYTYHQSIATSLTNSPKVTHAPTSPRRRFASAAQIVDDHRLEQRRPAFAPGPRPDPRRLRVFSKTPGPDRHRLKTVRRALLDRLPRHRSRIASPLRERRRGLRAPAERPARRETALARLASTYYKHPHAGRGSRRS